MRRGPKPAKSKEAKLPGVGKSRKDEGSRVRDLEKRLAEALEQRTAALEQQTATAEILGIISGSPSDAQPVFDSIAANALRLCGAYDVIILRKDGDVLRRVAHHGPIPPPPDGGIFAPTRDTIGGRTVLEGRAIHVADLQSETEEFPVGSRVARQVGSRTVLCVPLLHEGVAIGAIYLRRTEVQPFTDSQIALLQTFADQAVIAIENVRLFTELQASNRELTTALDQQTATSEILRVISRSQTDVQPVFDTIVQSAVRLCAGLFGALFQFDGELLHMVAHHNYTPEALEAAHRVYPARPSRDHGSVRAIVERAVVHIPDVELDPEHQHPGLRRAIGQRSGLFVPMLREGDPIGVIMVARPEPGPFSNNEIELLKTFADQAVIAIENVRLFTELQEKNQALATAHAQVSEALEQQTATAEILRTISTSPSDVRPVLDAVVQAAARFCDAPNVMLARADGAILRLVAGVGSFVEEAVRRAGGLEQVVVPIDRGSVFGRSAVEKRTVHVADLAAEPEEEYPTGRALQSQFGHRTLIGTPLLRDGAPVGVIGLFRYEVRPFSEKQISRLAAFADQAVIAIENVRLFTELQASNRELTTALDTQTATSDILRVISRSQTNVQPVFDAIVASAVHLLGAYTGALTQIAGDQIELAALTSTDDAGDAATRARFPQSLQSEGSNAQAIRDRAPINIADAQTDPRTPEAGRATARARGYRSQVVVPLLRHDEAVGTIAVSRREPGGFTDDEIALLQIFADQAVIAIENARLLNELQARTQELTRSVEQLTALGEVGRAVSSTLDLETVLTTIVSRAVELSGLDGGVVFEYDEAAEEFVQRVATETGGVLAEARRTTRIRKGEGVLGRTAITLEPIQVPDITVPGAHEGRLRENLIESGIRAVLAVPMVYEGRLIGGLGVTRNRPGEFPAETIELMRTFATQSALAIQNARLFREIEEKSRQLEVASQHKSEFLANMSHELRTPLNAIIGFSEVLSERMFGELNEKQEEYLKDIYASGTHLLSLINDILDLSKIEAGRMELELTDFDLPTAIDNALTLVRERAGRRAITLEHSVDERLGEIRGDERKVKQVLLNLLSNALKFTPEGGRVEVRAGMVDGMAEISVTDTGVGIAPEDQEAIFEEFRQVGTADKKAEGTGLGLTLCRKFIELHGGRIWVKSQVGVGSTFTLTIPVHSGE